MTRQELINALKKEINSPNGSKYELLTAKAFDYIRNNGKYDFCINYDLQYNLYIKLYNNKGEFFGTKFWGAYTSSDKILKILYNILRFEFGQV